MKQYSNSVPVRGRDVLFVRSKNYRWKRKRLALLSFLVPILLMLGGFAVMRIFPFGSNTTLAVDLRNEYVGFYEAYRHAFTESGSFFYSFTKSLGGEMAGTYAYYLMSPFNLLFFTAPSHFMPYLIEGCQLLKVGIAGLSFSLLVMTRDHGRDYRVVLFSTMYALSAFITANLLNHMWLDPIMVFPLIILGLERLLAGKNPLLYVVMLTYAIFTNFYIAYMGCIFLVVYTIYALVRQRKPSSYTRGQWINRQISGFFRFGVYSVIAAGIAGIVLFPALYTLLFSKGSYSQDVVANWELQYPVQDFFAKMLPGAFSYEEVASGLPNVFAGSLTLIFGVSYFFIGRFRVRERLCAFLLLAFLVLSMNVETLTVFWHGMQYPIWYEHRFSWLFSFFLVYLAFQASMRLQKPKILLLLFITALYAGLLAYLYVNLETYKDFLMHWHVLGSAAFFLFFLLALLLLRARKKAGVILLTVLVFLEMGLDAGVHTVVYNYEDIREFQKYDSLLTEALSDIRPSDKAFYRIEKTFMHDNNDGMRFTYPTITHFNSALERKSVDLFSRLGFATSANSINGTNPTKITDAIFGIRYYIKGNEEAKEWEEPGYSNLKAKSFRPDLSDYNEVRKTDTVTIYENEQYMPLGILAEDGIAHLKNTRMNPADFQDKLLNLLDGKEEEINYLKRLSMTERLGENMKKGMEQGALTTYSRKTKEKDASLFYDYRPLGFASHYISVSNTLNKNNTTLFLNGEELSNKRMGSHNSSQIYNVSASAMLPSAQELEIRLKEDKESFSINNVSLFVLDETNLKRAVTFQNEQGLQITKRNDRSITGTFKASRKTPYLLLTIPYDSGWKAVVDGKEVKTVELLDSLLAIPTSQGEHTLELNYELPFFTVGKYVSMGSLALFLLFELFYLITGRRRG